MSDPSTDWRAWNTAQVLQWAQDERLAPTISLLISERQLNGAALADASTWVESTSLSPADKASFIGKLDILINGRAPNGPETSSLTPSPSHTLSRTPSRMSVSLGEKPIDENLESLRSVDDSNTKSEISSEVLSSDDDAEVPATVFTKEQPIKGAKGIPWQFPSADFMGFLHKRGGGTFSSGWKRRWFVLDNSVMYYFKSSDMKELAGKFVALGCDVGMEPKQKRPVFFVRHKNVQIVRTFLMAGDTLDETNTWIDALVKHALCTDVRGADSPTPALTRNRSTGSVVGEQPTLPRSSSKGSVVDSPQRRGTVTEPPKLTDTPPKDSALPLPASASPQNEPVGPAIANRPNSARHSRKPSNVEIAENRRKSVAYEKPANGNVWDQPVVTRGERSATVTDMSAARQTLLGRALNTPRDRSSHIDFIESALALSSRELEGSSGHSRRGSDALPPSPSTASYMSTYGLNRRSRLSVLVALSSPRTSQAEVFTFDQVAATVAEAEAEAEKEAAIRAAGGAVPTKEETDVPCPPPLDTDNSDEFFLWDIVAREKREQEAENQRAAIIDTQGPLDRIINGKPVQRHCTHNRTLIKVYENAKSTVVLEEFNFTGWTITLEQEGKANTRFTMIPPNETIQPVTFGAPTQQKRTEWVNNLMELGNLTITVDHRLQALMSVSRPKDKDPVNARRDTAWQRGASPWEQKQSEERILTEWLRDIVTPEVEVTSLASDMMDGVAFLIAVAKLAQTEAEIKRPASTIAERRGNVRTAFDILAAQGIPTNTWNTSHVMQGEVKEIVHYLKQIIFGFKLNVKGIFNDAENSPLASASPRGASTVAQREANLCAFINATLEGKTIRAARFLDSDCQDGVLLVLLTRVITGAVLETCLTDPTTGAHKMTNITAAINTLQQAGLDPITAAPKDILVGNFEHTCNLLEAIQVLAERRRSEIAMREQQLRDEAAAKAAHDAAVAEAARAKAAAEEAARLAAEQAAADALAAQQAAKAAAEAAEAARIEELKASGEAWSEKWGTSQEEGEKLDRLEGIILPWVNGVLDTLGLKIRNTREDLKDMRILAVLAKSLTGMPVIAFRPNPYTPVEKENNRAAVADHYRAYGVVENGWSFEDITAGNGKGILLMLGTFMKLFKK